MVVNLIGFNVAYALLIVTAPQIDPSLNQQRVECMTKAMEVNHYISRLCKSQMREGKTF